MSAGLGFKAGKAGFCSQVAVGQKGRELWAQRKARDGGQAGAGAGRGAETQMGPRPLPSIELPALWRTDTDTPVKGRAPCREAQTMGA